jgi:hypothetical protein
MIRAIAPPPPDGTRWLPRKTSPGTGRLVGSPALSSPPNDRSRGHADLTYRCASARARRRAARARDRLRDLRRTGASARQRDPRDPRHHQQPSRHRPAHRRPPPWPVERPHRVGKALRHPPLQRGVVERARLLLTFEDVVRAQLRHGRAPAPRRRHLHQIHGPPGPLRHLRRAGHMGAAGARLPLAALEPGAWLSPVPAPSRSAPPRVRGCNTAGRCPGNPPPRRPARPRAAAPGPASRQGRPPRT